MYNLEAKNTKLAQTGGMASVPGQVPGLNNIPLNNQAQGEGGNAQPQMGQGKPGVPLDNAIYVLDQIAKATNPKEAQALVPEIAKIASETQTPYWADKLYKLENAIKVNSDPQHQTRNVETGEPEKLAQQLAEEIAAEMKNNDQTKQNLPDAKEVQAAKKQKNPDGPKKKTRGNPFRVLMGQVGKLLDHGMGKRDIVKYLLRKKYWNEETIGKAIDIVKDYNKKKHEKSEEKEASAAFNLHRYAQMIDTDETELANKIPFKAKNDDELTPDWQKRSTAELFARLQWLNSLKVYGKDKHRETEKTADSTGANSQAKQIRAELKKRGFSDEETQ